MPFDHPAQRGSMVHPVLFRLTRQQPLDTLYVLDDVASVARSYGHALVVLDQFGHEFVAQGLTKRKPGPTS